MLDCDTITQVKEKILDQIYKGTPYCHRPDPDTLDLGEQSSLVTKLSEEVKEWGFAVCTQHHGMGDICHSLLSMQTTLAGHNREEAVTERDRGGKGTVGFSLFHFTMFFARLRPQQWLGQGDMEKKVWKMCRRGGGFECSPKMLWAGTGTSWQ